MSLHEAWNIYSFNPKYFFDLKIMLNAENIDDNVKSANSRDKVGPTIYE